MTESGRRFGWLADLRDARLTSRQVAQWSGNSACQYGMDAGSGSVIAAAKREGFIGPMGYVLADP